MSFPRVCVVDASVAFKWYVPEPQWQTAVRLLDEARAGHCALLAPEWLVVEVANAAWQRCRRGDLTPAVAREMARDVPTAPLQWFDPTELVPRAIEIALDWGCTVYDAAYLALAEACEAPLVTADRRLRELTPAPWQEGRVLLLADLEV